MITKQIILTHHTRPDAYIENLKLWNPDFEILFFDNAQSEVFIAENFEKKVLQAYQDVKPGSFKADIFRYCALYILGGVYTDIQIPYQRGFSSLWDLSKDWLYLVQDSGDGTSVQISTMAAPPSCLFFKMCIEKAVENIESRSYATSPWSVTGPELAGEYLRKYIGRNAFTVGKHYFAVSEGEPIVSIDYRIMWLSGDAKKIARSAFVDKDYQALFPYKLNIHRGSWQQATHYYNAWHLKNIYGEKNINS